MIIKLTKYVLRTHEHTEIESETRRVDKDWFFQYVCLIDCDDISGGLLSSANIICFFSTLRTSCRCPHKYGFLQQKGANSRAIVIKRLKKLRFFSHLKDMFSSIFFCGCQRISTEIKQNRSTLFSVSFPFLVCLFSGVRWLVKRAHAYMQSKQNKVQCNHVSFERCRDWML